MTREYRAFRPAKKDVDAISFKRTLSSPEQINSEGLARRGYELQSRYVGPWKDHDAAAPDVDPEVEVERLRGIIADVRSCYAQSVPGKTRTAGEMDFLLGLSGIEASS